MISRKICILTSVHPAFDHRIFHKQVKSLLKAGYDVTLIAQHDKDETVDGVRIVALPKPKNRLRRILGTWRVFNLAFKQKADVYHFHDPELLPWGWLLQKLTHKPVIYDVHEYFIDTILFKAWIPYFLRKPIARIFDKVEKTLACRLAAIITMTEPMKQRRFSGCRGLCVSVCNFPILEIVDRAGESKGFDSRNEQYSVINTGKLTRERGFETILEAMDLVVKRHPEAICAILAETGGLAWLDEAHNSLMKRLIKEGSLKLIGRVPHIDVFQYLNISSIAWKPRLYYQETLDVTVFEYMACGKPIVASDVPLINNIIREASCGILVDPCDAKAHASAILYLLEHPDEARKMGENGRKAVVVKYNWEKESKKLIAVYEKLLKGR